MSTEAWDLFPCQSRGIREFTRERNRQLHELGFTEDHDEHHQPEELIAAGLCYAEQAHNDLTGSQGDTPPFNWPWEPEAWKPGDSTFENLEKAGALPAAAWDRLERAILNGGEGE